MLTALFVLSCLLATAAGQSCTDPGYTAITVSGTTGGCYKITGGNIDVILNGLSVGNNYYSVGISAGSSMSQYYGIMFQGGATTSTGVSCNAQNSNGCNYAANTGYTTGTSTLAGGAASIHMVRPLTATPQINLGTSMSVGVIIGPSAQCNAQGCQQHNVATHSNIAFSATTTSSTSSTTAAQTSTSTTTGTSSTSTTTANTGASTSTSTSTTTPTSSSSSSSTSTSTSTTTGNQGTGTTGAQGTTGQATAGNIVDSSGSKKGADNDGSFSSFVKNPTGLALTIGAAVVVVLIFVAVVAVRRTCKLSKEAASNGEDMQGFAAATGTNDYKGPSSRY